MNRHSLALVGIVALAIVAAVTLTLTGHPVPEWCGAVILAGVGALGGLALPGGGSAAGTVDVAGIVREFAALFGHDPAPSSSAASEAPAREASPLPAPTPVTDGSPS